MPEFSQQKTKNSKSKEADTASRPHSFNIYKCTENPLCAQQEILGNQAVQHLLQAKDIQPKLKISSPNDKYEQEADRIADIIMRMSESYVQSKQIMPLTNRQPLEDKTEVLLQAKENSTNRWRVSADIATKMSSLNGGQPLPDSIRSYFEPRFGYGFSDIRIHTDSLAADASRAVNARAFTVGRDIVFGARQYAPDTTRGRQLLAHELTHVIQQGCGAFIHAHGTSIRQSESHEQMLRFHPPSEETKEVIVERPVKGTTATATEASEASGLSCVQSKLTIGQPNDRYEQKAHRLTDTVIQMRESTFRQQDKCKANITKEAQIKAKPISNQITPLIQQRQQHLSQCIVQRKSPNEETKIQTERTVVSSLLPGYSQKGDTCGAASLVSALLIWDRQNWQKDQPNEMVVTAINIVLTWLDENRTETIEGWSSKSLDGETIYREITSGLTTIRDKARLPGRIISEDEYQFIGISLYALYIDEQRGLSVNEISSLQAHLGLEIGRGEAGILNYQDLFRSSTLRGLKPGQIAQVGWYVKKTKPDKKGRVSIGHHAFLIGRFQSGEWFLSDQGPRPPAEFMAPTLKELQAMVAQASREGRYRLLVEPIKVPPSFGWTGVKLLAGPVGVRAEAAGLVAPGTFLAEVDAGFLTVGDKIIAGNFVSRHYSLGDAHVAAGGVGREHGAFIAEMPKGVFNIYETNKVETPNVVVKEIDKGAGGLLTRRTFYSAELVVTDGNTANLLRIY